MKYSQLPITKHPNPTNWTAAEKSSRKRKTEREIEQLYASGALFSSSRTRRRKGPASRIHQED